MTMNLPDPEEKSIFYDTLLTPLLRDSTPEEVIKVMLNMMGTPAESIKIYAEALDKYANLSTISLALSGGPQGNADYLVRMIHSDIEDILQVLRVASQYIRKLNEKD